MWVEPTGRREPGHSTGGRSGLSEGRPAVHHGMQHAQRRAGDPLREQRLTGGEVTPAGPARVPVPGGAEEHHVMPLRVLPFTPQRPFRVSGEGEPALHSEVEQPGHGFPVRVVPGERAHESTTRSSAGWMRASAVSPSNRTTSRVALRRST